MKTLTITRLLGGVVLASTLQAAPVLAQQQQTAPAPAPQAAPAPVAQTSTCDPSKGYCHDFSKAKQYYMELNPNATQEEWLKMEATLRPFTDPEIMAEIMADPARLSAWMTALMDPDAIHLMMRCSQEPVMWNTWLRTMTNPVKIASAMIPFVNPVTYLKWMIAPVNPQVYAGMAPLINGNFYADWGSKLATLKFYEPMYSWIYPQWTFDRVLWSLNPYTYVNMFSWLIEPFTTTYAPQATQLPQASPTAG